MSVNFENLTIGFHVLIISLMLAKFQANQRSIAMSSNKCYCHAPNPKRARHVNFYVLRLPFVKSFRLKGFSLFLFDVGRLLVGDLLRISY